LGNPGQAYKHTRHNAGFLCIDALCAELGVHCKKYKFHSLTAEAVCGAVRCLVIKPQTYMNDSGLAIAEAARFHKIPPERVLVIFDDVTLPPGQVRVRRKGSDGGHNGIKSIIAHLGSQNFPRIKIGVGAKPHPDFILKDWVLSDFSAAERAKVEEITPKIPKICELILADSIDEAMTLYNAR
jgi:PTH1 family peptidyl-tRNA hydrolase